LVRGALLAVLLAVPAPPLLSQASDPNASPPPPASHAELSGDIDRFATYDLFGNREPRYSRWNPYQQNPLKGDFPIFGDTGFLEVFARVNSNTKYFRKPGTGFDPDDIEKNNVFLGFEIKKDEDTFHPSPLKFRMLGNFQAVSPSALTGVVSEKGTLQEAVVTVRLFEVGGNFNLSFFEGGLRNFRSDLNGLIFNDTLEEGRIFGEFRKNLWRYSVAVGHTLPKDPASKLVSFNKDLPNTNQLIGAIAVQRDDLVPGWNAEFSLHANQDRRAADLDVEYAGVAFFGHVGRFIVQPAVYYAFGQDDLNPVSGSQQDISAYLGFLDVRYPTDFAVWRVGALYASGDSDPSDGNAGGFDSISDSVNVFGGPGSIFVGDQIALPGGQVVINANSALPSLRGAGGRSNFVNPGIFVQNVGADFVLTPKVSATANVNHVSFVDTAVLGAGIDKDAGLEGNIGVRWRPLLNENFVVEGAAAYLKPGDGLKSLIGNDSAYSVFINFLVVY